MIVVIVRENAARRIEAFSVSGHAGWADAGADIVCAAVSALTQTAVLAVEELFGLHPAIEREAGWLKCRLPAGMEAGLAARVNIVLETMWIGLKNVEQSYGENITVLRIRRRWNHAV